MFCRRAQLITFSRCCPALVRFNDDKQCSAMQCNSSAIRGRWICVLTCSVVVYKGRGLQKVQREEQCDILELKRGG